MARRNQRFRRAKSASGLLHSDLVLPEYTPWTHHSTYFHGTTLVAGVDNGFPARSGSCYRLYRVGYEFAAPLVAGR
jgi:hypothetical protein